MKKEVKKYLPLKDAKNNFSYKKCYKTRLLNLVVLMLFYISCNSQTNYDFKKELESHEWVSPKNNATYKFNNGTYTKRGMFKFVYNYEVNLDTLKVISTDGSENIYNYLFVRKKDTTIDAIKQRILIFDRINPKRGNPKKLKFKRKL